MIESRVRRARWAHETLYTPARRKVIYGGRGGGKSHEVAQALSWLANLGPKSYFGRPLRILLCRETSKSIKDSSFPEIVAAIHRMKLPGFKIMRNEIRHRNGSVFFSSGLSNVTEESIKSMHGIDIAWVEEAHRISQRSMDLLEPTVRKTGSEIIYTFNPNKRIDPVYQTYVLAKVPPPNSIIRKVGLYDNAAPIEDLFELIRQEQYHRKYAPNKHRHIWMGEPDDGTNERILLPYADLLRCVRDVPPEGYVYAGLDIAGTGDDYNALVIQQGGVIIYHKRWPGGKLLSDTFDRAVKICIEHGVNRFYFDETGLGYGGESELVRHDVDFEWEGINFSYGVTKPNKIWGKQGKRKVRQKDIYERRTSQLADALRWRVQGSIAYLNDDKRVDRGDCLWIAPDVDERERLLVLLSQPEEDESKSGKMIIDKQPKGEGKAKPPSPDSYDATALAFATDSRFGLTKPKWVA